MNRQCVSRFIARFILLPVFLLAACSAGGQKPSPEPETLIYANLTPGGAVRSEVMRFNAAHSGKVKIEIIDYFDEYGNGDTARLMTEMAVGHGPDILDMRGLPYQILAQKGYLEDLWPYIENDPELGREGVVEAPLKAAEINGGLYILFNQVLINTLVGAESVVGQRYSWTFEDLLEAFSSMPADSTVLNYSYDKGTVFYYIYRMSLEKYIDWETGRCSFDSEEFRASLQFVNSFPSEFDWTDDDEVNEELANRILSGRQMLDHMVLCRLADVQFLDAIYGLGGLSSFIGYPTEDGSVGSSFYLPYAAHTFALSSSCKNKEAAWDFLREFLLPQYADMNDDALWNDTPDVLLINRKDHERIIQFDMHSRKVNQIARSLYGGPTIQYRAATEAELARYEDFINQIDKIELYDHTVYDIVKETSGPYFAGDKTLDETVDLIQNRVSLYVNENR